MVHEVKLFFVCLFVLIHDYLRGRRHRPSIFFRRQPVTQLTAGGNSLYDSTENSLDACLLCVFRSGGSSQAILEAQMECGAERV